MLDSIRGGLLTYALSAVLMVGAAELGFFLGRRNKDRSDSDGRSQISMIEGALLGLLALLLGFTFSMAVNRFDARQDLEVREANAMGTTLLRAQILPPPAYETVKSKLREYADIRLKYVEAGTNAAKIREALQAGGRLQSELWAIAQEEARARPTQISGLLLSSLNDLFDLTEARLSALENCVPGLVWLMLYMVAMLTTGALGFGTGLVGRRIMLPITIIPVLLAGLMALLLDLDRPREGMLQVSQSSIQRFRDSLK